MDKLDELIENIEITNAGGRYATTAKNINPLLIQLGGKAICVDESHPNACDGSLLVEINAYMMLLTIRKMLNTGKNNV